MTSFKIKNRYGQDMFVHLRHGPACMENIAFLHHDAASSSFSPHMDLMARSFHNRGFTVFSVDGTHSIDPKNQSDGDFSDFTIDQHVTDMEDMIRWAQREMYVRGDFVLGGHGMGAYAAMKLAATEYHGRAENVLATAPFFDGVAFVRNLEKVSWRQTHNAKVRGYWVMRDGDNQCDYPDHKLQEWKSHSLLADTGRLTMPVHFIFAADDILVRQEEAREFARTVPGKKTASTLGKGGHNFQDCPASINGALFRAVLEIYPPPAQENLPEPAP